jgi:VWFA-related protein
MSFRVVWGLALATCSLFAQAGPPNLVRLNVEATDAGAPVTDLTLDDFKITDQGKPVKVVFYRPITSTGWALPVAAGQFTNRTPSGPPHSTVILLDLMNQSQADRLDAARTLGKSLQQLEAGDFIYLYMLTLEGTIQPIHPIGGKGGDDHTWTKDIDKNLDKAVKAASHARPAGMGQEDVVKKTFVALESLATQMGPLPGRRSIVWVTGGIPMVFPNNTTCSGDWVECALYVPHLAVTLEKAETAVFPLSYSSNLTPAVTRDMEEMAQLTGGRAVYREDISAVLPQLAKGAANSYTIAYDPGTENWDNKFHRIKIATERKGVKLQSRTRYYALPDQRPQADKQRAALLTAFQSPFDNPEIGLRVAPSEGGKKVMVHVGVADLVMKEQNGAYDGAVTMLISDIGGSGPLGDPALFNFNLHRTKEQHEKDLKEGAPLGLEHALKDGTQKIRVIVQDQATNQTGSLTFPAR